MSLLFLDTETTGLDPRVHMPWEVAIVEPDGTEHVWCWRPDPDAMLEANMDALAMNGFWDRAPNGHHRAVELSCAQAIARRLAGTIVVGSKPSFDVEMLTPWLRSWGFEPGWHHRPVCVATMAYGWLHGRAQDPYAENSEPRRFAPHAYLPDAARELPWRSDDLSRACGVEPPDGDERHTALGDARWVARWYRALAGEVSHG